MEVVVEYEYIADEDDELSIRRGDVITNVVKLSDGWLEGDLDGRRGAFPDNFVREIKKEEKTKTKEAPKKAQGHVADLANKLGHLKVGPPPAGTKVTKRDQPRRKLRAKVSYSYTPANDDELRLDVGDVVEVLKQEEEGWWEGMVNGKTGMFPSNFVEVQPEAEPEEPKTPVGNDKDKKKVKGVGLGNIFEHGPVHLKRTGEINKITTDTKTAPRVPEEKAQSTHSLTRNTAMKPAPALPPKDISENKKAPTSTDVDERFPTSPEYRPQNSRLSSGSGTGVLESIPEIKGPIAKPRSPDANPTGITKAKNAPTNDSTVSQLLDSCLYSDEERERSHVHSVECTHSDEPQCLHGDDFDHTSLDSEGCLLSPSSIDLYENDLEVPTPTSLTEQSIRSPISDLKDTFTNVNPLDGRKSAASKVSTGSDVPLDNSALSHARATPPPPLSFRKRRAKGTPKIKMDLHVPSAPITPVAEPTKPPRKRPRKFLSATGFGWTTSVSDKEPVELLHKSCLVSKEDYSFGMPDSCDVFVSANGTLSKSAQEQTIWGYKAGQFMLDPKRHPTKKKSVCFATKDTWIENEKKTPVEENEAPTRKCALLPKKTSVFKPIDAKKITDSVDLNREKMRSGKWRKPTKAENKEIQTIEAYNTSPLVQTPDSRRQSLRKTLSDRIAAAISPSPKRSRGTAFLKSDPKVNLSPGEDATKEKTNEITAESDTNISKETSPLEERPSVRNAAEHIDIVSATSIPVKEGSNAKISTTLPHGQHLGASGHSKDARPRKKSIRKRLSIKSPFSRFRQSKYKLNKQVSPMDVREEPVQTPFKREILDGSTYVRMPELEPSYLDGLKQLGRLSPSVRRISQRYCLFEKGPMSRSLELLDNFSTTSSVDDIDNQTMSLPQLTDRYAIFTTQREQVAEDVKAEACEDLNLVEENKENIPEDTNKRKSGKRFSLLPGFGTWPRRLQSPELKGEDTDSKSKPTTGEKKGTENQDDLGKRGQKRKRFSLLFRRSEASKPPIEKQDIDNKSRSASFLGSLRRRFSQRKTNKSASSHDVKLPEKRMSSTLPSKIIEYKDGTKRRSVMSVPALSPPRSNQLEVLVDDQVQYTSNVQDDQDSLAKIQKSRAYRRSIDLWKIESSPDCGEKWVARKRPSIDPAPSKGALGRKILNVQDYPREKLDQQYSEDNLLQTEMVTKETASAKKSQRTSIDTFFSRVDEGIGHEEIIEDDIEEDYVVVEDLTQIVYQQELDDAAETIVESVLRRAVQEVERELVASGIRPPKYNAQTAFWNACGNVREAAAEVINRAREEEQTASSLYRSALDDTPPYYRMMREDYKNLAAEENQTSDSFISVNLNNSNNNNCNFNNNARFQEDSRRFFDLRGEEEELMNLSPVTKTTGKAPTTYGATPQKDQIDTEFIDLLDAFFGKAPSPVSPEQARDMQQKLDDYVRYHDSNMTPGSCDSPATKRVRPSCSDEGYSTQSQRVAGSQIRHPEEAYSSSLDNWQLWHAALTQQASGPAVIAEPTEPMEVYYPRNRDYSESSSAEPGEILLDSGSNGSHIVGFVRAGLSSCSGSCESGGVVTTDHNRSLSRCSEIKPAGSMFYGDSPPADEETMKADGPYNIAPSPARADPSSRRAGSYFWDTSPCNVRSANETSTPKAGGGHERPSVDWWIRMEGDGPRVNHSGYALSPAWRSPSMEDRPVGIHYGSPVEPERTPIIPLYPEERPVGVHSGTTVNQSPEYGRGTPVRSPRLEDRPVGIHSGTTSTDKSPEYRRTTHKSPPFEDRPVGFHSGTAMEVTEEQPLVTLRSPRLEDRPVGIHGGHVPQPNGRSQGTSANNSYRLASLTDSSFYSPNSTINFSSSSIIDQLP